MEQLPEELVVNVCQNMDIPELKNFIITSKTHYRICDQILEDKFEEAIDAMIEASKVAASDKGRFTRDYSVLLEPQMKDRFFMLSYKRGDGEFVITEAFDNSRQFVVTKLGWHKGHKFDHMNVEADETKVRLILLDLLTNGYINGKFKTTFI